MSNVFKKMIVFCYAFFNVKINVFCILLGQSKIEGLTIFWDVNQEGVYIVLVTVLQKIVR